MRCAVSLYDKTADRIAAKVKRLAGYTICHGAIVYLLTKLWSSGAALCGIGRSQRSTFLS